MSKRTAVVWFRNDLRLGDHPALHQAVEAYEAVVPLFFWAPDEEGDWGPGGAQRWWLHHSLAALDADLRDHGLRLIVRQDRSLDQLRDVIDATGAEAVLWNRRYVPALQRRDDDVREALAADGIQCRVFASRILHEPTQIQTTSGGPYHVYTPFWKKLQKKLTVDAPLPRPDLGESYAPTTWPNTTALDALGLTPEAQDGVNWAEGFDAMWTPGEQAARERLDHFIDALLIDYDAMRNRPDRDGTSRLSPHLHHGELSPRQVWTAVDKWVQNAAMREAADAFLQEIAWREFSYHLLTFYPETPTEVLRDKYADFPWKNDDEALERWQRGETGYPIVDAGMRQLWQTGWMHNRVRMIVASFLTKDLLLPWQAGARWFWDALVDADLANNTMGWQWSAGSGADAQPFFRIFNPVSQSERYDPEGDYIRQYVPELAGLPNEHLHAPWDAPDDALDAAGITLGDTYPEPIVDHGVAREQALDAYQTIR